MRQSSRLVLSIAILFSIRYVAVLFNGKRVEVSFYGRRVEVSSLAGLVVLPFLQGAFCLFRSQLDRLVRVARIPLGSLVVYQFFYSVTGFSSPSSRFHAYGARGA